MAWGGPDDSLVRAAQPREEPREPRLAVRPSPARSPWTLRAPDRRVARATRDSMKGGPSRPAPFRGRVTAGGRAGAAPDPRSADLPRRPRPARISQSVLRNSTPTIPIIVPGRPFVPRIRPPGHAPRRDWVRSAPGPGRRWVRSAPGPGRRWLRFGNREDRQHPPNPSRRGGVRGVGSVVRRVPAPRTIPATPASRRIGIIGPTPSRSPGIAGCPGHRHGVRVPEAREAARPVGGDRRSPSDTSRPPSPRDADLCHVRATPRQTKNLV
jgi:hypothetical protein